jgi:acetoin utilization protein AcuC
MTITIAYTPGYLAWEGSHASPQRARLAVEHILARTESEGIATTIIEPEFDADRIREELALVHDPAYVDGVLAGKRGVPNKLQGKTASLMHLGTSDLVAQIEADGFKPQVYFNPQGAKHHAAKDHASGFCVFNDHAWAAQHWAAQGKKVAYLDWDAHHGDGVEALTRDNVNILTASIHQGGIFPGTGNRTSHKHRALNYPLDSGDGDVELLEAVEDALYAIRDFEPDVILLACGADGLAGDPLAQLMFTIEDGIIPAARLVGQLAKELGVPVLVGGAGGYQPFTYVPIAWAETILTIHEELTAPEARVTSMVFYGGLVKVSDEAAWPEEDVVVDDRADDTKARHEAIMDDLKGFPIESWEDMLTSEERGIVEETIRPILMAHAEKTRPSTKGQRNDRRRKAKHGTRR